MEDITTSLSARSLHRALCNKITPNIADALMDAQIEKGLAGDSMATEFIFDRVRGKAQVHVKFAAIGVIDPTRAEAEVDAFLEGHARRSIGG